MGGCCATPSAAAVPDRTQKYSASRQPAAPHVPDFQDAVQPFHGEALVATPSTVAPTKDVTLEWALTEGVPSQGDWIGVYEGAGEEQDDTGCCISSLVTSGARKGKIVLSAPEKAGLYHFRYFFADGIAAAVSKAFTVIDNTVDTPGADGSPHSNNFNTGGVTIINEDQRHDADWVVSSVSGGNSSNTLTAPHNYHSVDYNRLENRRSSMGLSELNEEDANYTGQRRSSEPAKRRNSMQRRGGPVSMSGAGNPVFEVHEPTVVIDAGDVTQAHSVHTLDGPDGWAKLATNDDVARSPIQLANDGNSQWDAMDQGTAPVLDLAPAPAPAPESAPAPQSLEAEPLPAPLVSMEVLELKSISDDLNSDDGLDAYRSTDSILSDGVDTMMDEILALESTSDSQPKKPLVRSNSQSSLGEGQFSCNSADPAHGSINGGTRQIAKQLSTRASQLLNSVDLGLSMPPASLRSSSVYQERAKKNEGYSYPDTQTIPVPEGNMTLKVANVTITNINPEEPSTKPNQDAFLVDACLNGDRNKHLFGVFDGHGPAGHHCSQFVRNNLSDALRHCAHFNESIEKAYHAAFRQINLEMHREPSVDDLKSGTTAITVCIDKDDLFVANIGDSRAILIQSDELTSAWTALDLSNDHTPFRDDELKRVVSCGAQVMTLDELEGLVPPMKPSEWTTEDPPRCWVPCCGYPGTAFTRSCGDLLAESIGVNAVPEVLIHKITQRDEAIVICSDGVTEFLSSQDIVDMVAKQRGNELQAAKSIALEAQKLWLECDEHTDDITIIIVTLHHQNTAKEDLVVENKLGNTASYTSMTGDWYDAAFMQLASTKAIRPLPSKRLQSQRRRADGPTLSLLASLSGTEFMPANAKDAPLDSMSLRLKGSKLGDYKFETHPKTPTQEKALTTSISNTMLCHRMSDNQVQAVVALMEKVAVPNGSAVFEAGEEGEWFYVLESGEFGAFQDFGSGSELIHKYVKRPYGAPPSFGEMALLHGKPRPATVKALTNGASVWRLHKQAWLQQRKVASEAYSMLPDRGEVPYQHPTLLPAKTAEEVNKLEKAVMCSPLFCRLSQSDRARLFDVMTKTRIAQGDTVYSQGEAGRAMYVVESGELSVTVTDHTGEGKVVHHYTKGSCFGEQALIDNHSKRGSTVRAESACVLWMLHYTAFQTTIKLLMSFMGCS